MHNYKKKAEDYNSMYELVEQKSNKIRELEDYTNML